MRKLRTSATGLLLFLFAHEASAAHPPLDRPTPPPCCADGQCYPNYLTFGVYPTRWRRWPLEFAEPASGAAAGRPTPVPPSELDFPVIAPPPSIEEDRKAPPPSAPRDEPLRTAPTTGGPGSETRTAPTGPAPPSLPTGPLGPPSTPGERTTIPRTLPPYQPTSPGSRSLDPSGPTSDADPPPSLPFAMPPAVVTQQPMPLPIVEQPAAQITSPGPMLPAAHPPAPTSSAPVPQNPTSDDPPPSLPGTLAGLAN